MQQYVEQCQYVHEGPIAQLESHLITNLAFGKNEGDKVRFLAGYLINQATVLNETMSMKGLQGVVDMVRVAGNVFGN